MRRKNGWHSLARVAVHLFQTPSVFKLYDQAITGTGSHLRALRKVHPRRPGINESRTGLMSHRRRPVLLRKFPPATRFHQKDIGTSPVPTRRQLGQARRAAIARLVAKGGPIPSLRAIEKLLSGLGHRASHSTLSKDYRLLGLRATGTGSTRHFLADDRSKAGLSTLNAYSLNAYRRGKAGEGD